MKRLLLPALVALSACQQSLVNVGVTVYPDKKGEVLYHAWIPTDAAKGEKANRDGVFENVNELGSFDIVLRLVGGKFDDLNKVKIGDVTFEFAPGEKQSVLKVTIPATMEAKWYKTLGISEAQFKKFEEIEKMDVTKAGPQKEATQEPPAVVFAMTLPGNGEEQKILEPAPAPAWKMDSEARGEFGGENKNTAYLVIPLDDIRSGKVKKVVWQITCGPLLDKVKEAWEKYKKGEK